MYEYVIYTSRKKFPYENNCCFYEFRDLLFYFKTSLRQSLTMWLMLDFTQLRWFEWQMPIIGLCVLTFASQVELFGGIPNLSAGRPNWRKCITEASLNDGESHSTSLSTSLYLACGLNIIAWNPAPVACCLAFPGLYGHSPSGIVASNKLSSTTCFSQSVLRQH